MAEQYEDAIDTSKRAIALKPDRVIPYIILSAANNTLGRQEEAKTEAAEVLRINPNFTVSGWMKSRLQEDPADTERYAGLLLAAGLPENSQSVVSIDLGKGERMTEERAKRKLRAILSADAVGYSRLM